MGGIPLSALQPSALHDDGTIAWDEARAALPIPGGERFIIREGEVLLPLRSQRLRAVVARHVPAGVLATGHWALVAPDPAHLDADYLAWYLNLPSTRVRLASAMIGSSISFLPVAAVRDFEVEVPDLRTQRRIGRAAVLTARVARLEQALAAARQTLTDALARAALARATLSTAS